MKDFAELYAALDETNKTNEKVAAMVEYFRTADPADAAWVVYFLSGRKIKRVVNARRLAEWATEAADLPGWMFAECYDAVGDMAETITLLLPETDSSTDQPLNWWVRERLIPLAKMDEPARKATIYEAWAQMSTRERFVWNKLLTGAFRVGVSQRLTTRALAEVSGVEPAVIAHRLMGEWTPTPAFFARVVAEETSDTDISRPYPFFLAYPVDDDDVPALGDVDDWQTEWKWDGIRAQLVKREGQVFIWSRGEELVTDRYPEVAEAAERLPDGVVLDGELLPWIGGAVLPFAQLQRRIGRKTLGRKLLAEVPVVLLTYDLLEYEGEDVREQPLTWRRARLETVVQAADHPHLLLSEIVEPASWDELADLRATSRDRNVEGFMLKRKQSPYRVGRKRGDWWKWKVEPYTVDAVLIYAQRGSGRRAGLYTDYTFAVWDDDGELVPFAKAYSGLTNDEISEVDNFVRRNVIERFGPVRSVKPELVFELAFEGIRRSSRHKSGVAVRFPRILRWRRDKPPAEADTLETVRALLPDG